MIIQPVGEFKTHYQEFETTDKDAIDILISSMLTSSLLIKSLAGQRYDDYIQFKIKKNKLLQFIVDIENDSLIVLMFNSS